LKPPFIDYQKPLHKIKKTYPVPVSLLGTSPWENSHQLVVPSKFLDTTPIPIFECLMALALIVEIFSLILSKVYSYFDFSAYL